MADYLSRPRIEGPIWLELSDLSFLRTRFSEIVAHIEVLDTQIDNERADEIRIFELKRQKDAKLVEITSLQNILSPIRRIPSEILCEILELSFTPKDGIFRPAHDVIYYTSMLSRICVAWRKAAYGSPRFWSKLCFSVREHRKILLGDVAQIKEWISRSQDAPLDVYLNLFLAMYNEERLHRASQLLDCILESRHRIRLIHVRGMAQIFLPLFRQPHSSLPALEEVSLILIGDNDHLFGDGVEAFLGAPKLRRFSVSDSDDSSILHTLKLPLEQLTSFKITSSSHRRFSLVVYQDILSQCKNLVSLETDIAVRFGFSADLAICLPALKSLDICYRTKNVHSKAGDDLLPGLITPRLENLTLQWLSESDSLPLSKEIVGLQNRSSTALSSLALILRCDAVESDTNNFSSILAAFPTVRLLRIDAFNFYLVSDLIRALIYIPGHPVVLPKLTTLELSGKCRPYELQSMIDSRRWPANPGVNDQSVSKDGVSRLQNVRSSDNYIEQY